MTLMTPSSLDHHLTLPLIVCTLQETGRRPGAYEMLRRWSMDANQPLVVGSPATRSDGPGGEAVSMPGRTVRGRAAAISYGYARIPSAERGLCSGAVFGYTSVPLSELVFSGVGVPSTSHWLANRLGHDTKIFENVYRQQESTIEVAKISRLMMAVDSGEVGKFVWKSLDQIQFSGNTKRVNCILDKSHGCLLHLSQQKWNNHS